MNTIEFVLSRQHFLRWQKALLKGIKSLVQCWELDKTKNKKPNTKETNKRGQSFLFSLSPMTAWAHAPLLQGIAPLSADALLAWSRAMWKTKQTAKQTKHRKKKKKKFENETKKATTTMTEPGTNLQNPLCGPDESNKHEERHIEFWDEDRIAREHALEVEQCISAKGRKPPSQHQHQCLHFLHGDCSVHLGPAAIHTVALVVEVKVPRD